MKNIEGYQDPTGLTPEEIHIAMRNLEILEERMKEGNDR